MIEHDFATFDGESPAHQAQRRTLASYALSQAFFYAADLWVDRPPLVSLKALEYAKQRWGPQADKVWTLKRAEIPKVDGCSISQSGLIYEHVTTGSMFREFLSKMMAERSGTLDDFAVACWLRDNFQTAWITREEDRELTSRGFKSLRGSCLAEAREIYQEKCGIKIVEPPLSAARSVLVGDTVLVEESDEEREVDARRGAKYAPFFDAVRDALREVHAPVEVVHHRDDYYGYLTGAGGLPRGVKLVLLLDAPKGATVRTPTASLEAPTDEGAPFSEPTTAAWHEIRAALDGANWRIGYGRRGVDGGLCRCMKSLTHAFDLSDDEALQDAAMCTATEIVALCDALAN